MAYLRRKHCIQQSASIILDLLSTIVLLLLVVSGNSDEMFLCIHPSFRDHAGIAVHSLPAYFVCLFCWAVSMVHAFTGTYGVNYGRIADNLTEMSISQDRAVEWVKQNVEPFLPATLITGIAVGNEILGQPAEELAEVLYPAVRNVYSALSWLGLARRIEVSSPHSEAVFAITYPPSAGAFKENVLPFMMPLLQFFSEIGTPFYINAYPFLAYKSDPEHIDLNYALFARNSGIYDARTRLHYDNMFDAQIDAAYAALDKVGFNRMEVIVSETGWASRGDGNEAGANLRNARTYNSNLRKRLLKKKGTPYRPRAVVKGYVFALFNENMKPGPTSERNFGLFRPDGRVAYDIGFTGLVPSSALSLLGSWSAGRHTDAVADPDLVAISNQDDSFARSSCALRLTCTA